MEMIFKRLGIHLPRNTQANWMIKGHSYSSLCTTCSTISCYPAAISTWMKRPFRCLMSQQKSIPQVNKIRAWLDKVLENTPPKGKAGVAIAYMHKNWKKLASYTQDGRLNIDNNPVEKAIRPFAIGRKNWMFSDSQRGAKASAM
jgi:hypothetical protein